MEYTPTARAALSRQHLKLHDLAVSRVGGDELCRRLMAIPGSAAIDDLSRFRRSRDVAAYSGPASKR
jgi:transposase